MKQSPQLRLGQSLTMTPQLQQAIRLLQLSTLELQNETQQVLDSNPLLESTDDASGDNRVTSSSQTQNSDNNANDDPGQQERTTIDQSVRLDEQGDIPKDLPVDSAWDDIYDIPKSQGAATGGADVQDYLINKSVSETLREHLVEQLDLIPFGEVDFEIATAIIDTINQDGYLTTSLEELHRDLSKENDIELDEVEAVLHQIQNFDPSGVAACNLAECLSLQLKHFSADIPWKVEALAIINNWMDLLAARDYKQLKRKMRLSDESLKKAIELIRSLNPRPGSTSFSSEAQYIVPDVFVKKYNGVWMVELNGETTPKLRINNHYASMIRFADASADNKYLKNQLQEAKWFIKSLQSRNETLLKVSTCIVEKQRGFLEHGEEAMKPLVLRDVAEIVSMHESTISRVTNQKFMHTPQGIFELKYFFSSHVNMTEGGECSATAIRAFIKKLVANEVQSKPLSDNTIAVILSEQGIKVARRTVAKYRESLGIAPSNERKHLM